MAFNFNPSLVNASDTSASGIIPDTELWLIAGQDNSSRYRSFDGGRSWDEDAGLNLGSESGGRLNYNNTYPFALCRTEAGIYFQQASQGAVLSDDDSVSTYTDATIDGVGSYDSLVFLKPEKSGVLGWEGAMYDFGGGNDILHFFWMAFDSQTDSEVALNSYSYASSLNVGLSYFGKDYDQQDARQLVHIYNTGFGLELRCMMGGGGKLRTASLSNSSPYYPQAVNGGLSYAPNFEGVLIPSATKAGSLYWDLKSNSVGTIDLTAAYTQTVDSTNVVLQNSCYDEKLNKFVAVGYINDGSGDDGKVLTYIINPDTWAVESYQIHDELYADYSAVNTGRCRNGNFALIGLADCCIMASNETSSGDLKMWWSDDGFATKTACVFDTEINGITDFGVVKRL